MRKRLLFLAVMLGMAFTAVKAESTIMVKGQEIAFSGGTAKVDNILLFENKTTKQVTVFFRQICIQLVHEFEVFHYS